MKRLIALLGLLSLVAVSVPAQDKHGDSHAPKRGGVVVETKVADLELVARPDGMLLYVTEHGGKDMKLTSGSGKVTVFNGTEKAEAPLTLAGNWFEAKGNFKVSAGTRVLVEVSLNGKPPVAARFTLKQPAN